jgi:hypothetical protein
MATKSGVGDSTLDRMDGGLVSYEAPVLTPIGSLHDILAGGGTKGCDNGTPELGPLPFNDPSCTGG